LINKNKLELLLKKEFLNKEVQRLIEVGIQALDKSKKLNETYLLKNKRILKIEKSNYSETNLNFGFPFPLISYIEKSTYNNYKINYYFQGDSIRKMQLNLISYINNVVIEKVSDKVFLDISTNYIKEFSNEIIYIEPYQFIGDSYISLYIPNTIETSINQSIEKFSYNTTVAGTYPFQCHNPIKFIQHKDRKLLIIQPDFIDDHFDNTKNLILIIKKIKSEIVLFILGRNIIVRKKKNSSTIICYKKIGNDTVLWNNNIEIMLKNSLNYFLNTNDENNFNEIHIDKNNINILINPHTSSKNKDISMTLLNHLTKIKCSSMHILKTKQLNINININIITPVFLHESYDAINNSNLVFTADTSIAHIANSLGKITFVFYNINSWGNNFLSLIHNSFLGFASKNINFIPILLDFKKFKYLDLLINSIIELYSLNKFNEYLLESIEKYLNAVSTENIQIIKCSRLKVLSELTKVSFNIRYLHEYYFDQCIFNENTKNNIINIDILIELLSPLYKISLNIHKVASGYAKKA